MRCPSPLPILFVLLTLQAPAQQREPIELIYADSLVGVGPTTTGMREFVGNVKFKQGDVTVTCDRAIHYISENRADLFGHVVVTQGALQMRSPIAAYDGNARFATAQGGITVIDSGKVLTARRGTYSTATHIATFRDSVKAVDDTLIMWADEAVYERETEISTARGRVVAYDTVRRAIIRGDSIYHNPKVDYLRIMGDAALWRWDSTAVEDTLADSDSSRSVGPDTTYLIADLIEVINDPEERYIATGNVELISGTVAARADSMDHRVSLGNFQLFEDPVVWADSAQLLADTIVVYAPNDLLDLIVGINNAIMVSRSDTARPDRYDQVAGRIVTLDVDNDTVRKLTAVDNAKSITWRVEEDSPEGLAKFASDTIKAEFEGGSPVDIFWLGGVAGEHHPEAVAGGREESFLLEGFDWRTDKPTQPPSAKPFSTAPPRKPLRGRAGREVESSSTKKK